VGQYYFSLYYCSYGAYWDEVTRDETMRRLEWFMIAGENLFGARSDGDDDTGPAPDVCDAEMSIYFPFWPN